MKLAAIAKLIQPVVSKVTTPNADPRRLKPGHLVQLLNSQAKTPVIDDRKLRGWRAAAGSRIGDGKTIDLFRLIAWLAAKRHGAVSGETSGDKPGQDSSPEQDTYGRRKERERERQASQSRSGRDIAPLPVVADPARRAKATKSLRFFCEAYFPDRFTLKWSPDHLTLIGQLQKTIDSGGLHAFALPRGSGKTTLVEVAAIWAVITGRRKYVAVIGASSEAAEEMLQAIKAELEVNDLLAADWPEVCYPIHRLEGITNRCRGQLCEGERTRIHWAGLRIVLPSVAGSLASGAIISVRGITGRIRGQKFVRPDGKTVRPDFAIIDDAQTDESAASPTQTQKRINKVTGAVLGLAGPGKKISAVFPCTVIQKGDMADQFLDRKKNPAWNGVRCRLVNKWPEGEAAVKLWDEYAMHYRRSLEAGGEGEEATAYLKKNFKVMHTGSEVAWPQRKEPDDLSALQHAYNLRIRYPLTFDAEYQNEPPAASEDRLAIVPLAHELQTKLSHVPRLVVPQDCDQLTGFIDCQQDVLFDVVAAWASGFSGSVIAYGSWPEQNRHYFTLNDLSRRLRDQYSGADIKGALLMGLRDRLRQIICRVYLRQDGTSLRMGRVLVDAGYEPDIVYQVCAEEEFAGVAMPSFGRSFGPRAKPLMAYDRKPGESIGLNWQITRNHKRAIQHCLFDSNWWKAFLFDRFNRAGGDVGALTLFGSESHVHWMIGDHLTAEKPDQLTAKESGRTVTMFDCLPGRDNHWLDGAVGCLVAGSMLGVSLGTVTGAPQSGRKRRRYTAADTNARRRA